MENAPLSGAGARRETHRAAETYLAEHPVARLHLGAGDNQLPGWLNSDFPDPQPGAIVIDATQPFPLPDASFDFIFAEHMIEHLPYPGGKAMIAECFRVLKPGGVVRISTPDVLFLVRLLRADRSPFEQGYIRWAAGLFERGEPATALGVFNNFVRAWGHLFIYDAPTLAARLHRAGFADLVRTRVGHSHHAELRGIDNEKRMPEGYLALESMIFEASRPA